MSGHLTIPTWNKLLIIIITTDKEFTPTFQHTCTEMEWADGQTYFSPTRYKASLMTQLKGLYCSKRVHTTEYHKRSCQTLCSSNCKYQHDLHQTISVIIMNCDATVNTYRHGSPAHSCGESRTS